MLTTIRLFLWLSLSLLTITASADSTQMAPITVTPGSVISYNGHFVVAPSATNLVLDTGNGGYILFRTVNPTGNINSYTDLGNFNSNGTFSVGSNFNVKSDGTVTTNSNIKATNGTVTASYSSILGSPSSQIGGNLIINGGSWTYLTPGQVGHNNGCWNTGCGDWNSNNNNNFNYSLKTTYGIWSQQGFIVYSSDARIKNVLAVADKNKALDVIQKLKIVDYSYIDHLKGQGVKKGLIAQDVEKIYPNAVSQQIDFIPDIYQFTTDLSLDQGAKELTVGLTKAHGLKVGDEVQIFTSEELIPTTVKVVRVPSPKEFIIGPWTTSIKRIFVYGKKVDDLRVLDYDQLFVIGLGAIQQLASEKDEQDKKIAALEARLQKLELAAHS